MKIIAFSGKKHSGKTSALNYVAKMLVNDVHIHNFADALKIIVARTFIPADEIPDKTGAVDWIDAHKDYHIEAVNMDVRQMLQFLGTDMFRAMWGDVWLNAFLHRLPEKYDTKKGVILVGDMRFPNEAELIHALGGKIIRLTRDPNNGADTHASETALDDYTGFDTIIDNTNLTEEQAGKMVWDTVFRGKGWL